MKKQLLGTTTLVAAGLLMGQGAYAAEPMSLSIGGYLQQAFSVADDDDGVGQPGAAIHDNTIATDGEIQFTATTELDNGISVRARIEYEAFPAGGSQVDETYTRFSGGFGSFTIGNDDNASYQMAYQAPSGSWQMGLNSPTFAIPASGGNAITSYTSLYMGTGGDGGKLIYFTPRMNGFQLGASYQPDGAGGPPAAASARTADTTAGGAETILTFGANYSGSFDQADVAISAGYITADLEAQNTAGTAKDFEGFTAGLNVSMSGFTVGGAVTINNGGAAKASTDRWEIGATYATGPWTIGANYFDIDQSLAATVGDDSVDGWMVSGQYNLGPGVDLFGGVKYYDFEDAANAIGSENSVLIGALGTSIYF
jgi:outer membrane protein OmpU